MNTRRLDRPNEALGIFALGRASLVYALGGLAYKGVALVSIPILARLLTPVELGLLDLAAVLASILGLVATVGTDQAVAYFEPRTKTDDAVWESSLTIIAAAAAGLLLVVGIFHESIARFVTGASANGPVLMAATVYGGIIALTATTLNAVRLRGSPRTYVVGSFAIVSAEMAAALAVAWLLPGEVALMVLGWAVAALLVALPILSRHLPSLRIPRVVTIRRLIGYGAPLVPAAIVWLIGDAWIRSTLGRDVDFATLGAYGIGHRITSVLGLAITGFGVVWHPYIYRTPPSEIITRASRTMPHLVLALTGLGVFLTVLSPEIVGLVAGDRYAGARHAVAGLSGGMVAMGVFVLVSAVTAASGSTGRIAVAAVIGTMVQVATSVPLVQGLGISGAATASLLGYTAAAVLLLAGERALLAGRRGAWFAGTVALSVVSLTIGQLASTQGLPLRLGMIAAVGLVAALMLWPAVKGSRSAA